MANIKDLIKEKELRKIKTNIPLDDINKNLILSLFGVSLYGKDGHDEEILEIIIGGANSLDEDQKMLIDEFKDKKVNYGKNLKLSKTGFHLYNNKIVLTPKGIK